MHTPPAKGANLSAEPQINKPRTQPRQVPANRTIKTESCKGPAEQVCRCTNSAIIAIDAPTLIRCFTARAAMPSVVDKAGPPLGPNLQYQKRQPYRVTRGCWLCSYSSQRACVCLMVDRADADRKSTSIALHPIQFHCRIPALQIRGPLSPSSSLRASPSRRESTKRAYRFLEINGMEVS